MSRKLKALLVGIFLALPWIGAASAAEVDLYCYVSGPPFQWAPCSSVTPLVVAAGPYSYTPLTPGQYTPVSDAAATSLTIPTGATYAVVCAEGANHRFTWDGTTTPTASVGTLLASGACASFSGAAALAAFKIITVTAGGTFTASYAK